MAKIIVENIVKTFNKRSRNANKVLKGVSFSLPEKGLVCIFGKSGSGKTTLLNIIGGLEKADRGKVYIDGVDTYVNTDKIRNTKIGFIFQNYYLEKGYTVKEILKNQMIIAGFKDEIEINRRCAESLKLVSMERFKNKQGDTLSGGQQQRVAIARAILKGSDIILADEPTGNLDALNTIQVMEILKEISKTKLVLMVTHEVTLIKKYATSNIMIVDGQLVEDSNISDLDIASSTYDVNNKNELNSDMLLTFKESTSKRNGRLFRFKNFFKRNDEKKFTTANIFKQIFLLVISLVICFLSFRIYEIYNSKLETKPILENTVYTNLNSYSVLRRCDESKYECVDFFDTEMKTGSFSYAQLSSLSGIDVKYTPKSIEQDEMLDILYGRMPEGNEVVVSRKMAEVLKKEFRVKDLNQDKAITLMTFDGQYNIVGITPGDEKEIYFNKVDYVNFLGVYNKISFDDNGHILFKDSYSEMSYSAQILLYDDVLDNDKVLVELNRNSLYKMMSNTKEVDYEVDKTNSVLKTKPYSIQLSGSKVYVERFEITRDVMQTDIRIYVNENVLKNIFVYISPNLDVLSLGENQCYFEIKASNDNTFTSLKKELRDLGVTTVNISRIYEMNSNELKDSMKGEVYLFIVVIILLLIIYFFIEKSGSIKNSKEYGIYRAIGVNKGNLLFKETVNAILNNILSYFIFFTITVILISIRYWVMNISFLEFIGISLINFVISSIIMILLSIIPYLFVLTKSPSEILARYDI